MTRMVGAIRGFAAFWWDFIVGDDWRIAAGVVTTLVATSLLANTDLPAWWLLPLVVAALFVVSLHRATRRAR